MRALVEAGMITWSATNNFGVFPVLRLSASCALLSMVATYFVVEAEEGRVGQTTMLWRIDIYAR